MSSLLPSMSRTLTRGGRFSGVHWWPVLGVHRGPREHSSGTRQRFGRISKRGNPYLRMVLVHGARSVLCHAKRDKSQSHDHLRLWALNLLGRTSHNKAAVALASKLVRIVWAVLKHDRPYESLPVTIAA